MTCSRCRNDFEPFDNGKVCRACRDYKRAYNLAHKDDPKCSRCNQPFKPDGGFKRCQECRDYLDRYCAENKEREKARHAEWAAKNLARLAAYRRRRREKGLDLKAGEAYRKRHPEKVKAVMSAAYHAAGYKKWVFPSKYGISKERYEAIRSRQDGRCAICQKTPKRDLYVDHCHKTKQVRGLLCSACNTGLGHFKDSAMNLMNAIVYLNKGSVESITLNAFK